MTASAANSFQMNILAIQVVITIFCTLCSIIILIIGIVHLSSFKRNPNYYMKKKLCKVQAICKIMLIVCVFLLQIFAIILLITFLIICKQIMKAYPEISAENPEPYLNKDEIYFCEHCGKPYEAQSSFCPFCGCEQKRIDNS